MSEVDNRMGAQEEVAPLNRILGSIEGLEGWLDNNYEGWDPYDGINSEKIANMRWGYPYLQMAMVQFHRLSPLNMRKLFGIKKGVSTKALSLFMRSFLNLYSITEDERYLKEASRLGDMIIGDSLYEKYGEHAWASHYFKFVSVDKGALTPGTFDIIGTCNVLKSLSSLHQINGDPRLKEVIQSCQTFLGGTVDDRDGVTYILYGPEYKGKVVPNASAEALGAIASSFRSHPNEELRTLFDDVLASVLKLQRPDGSWVYSIYPDGREYNQLDFHQGYMIDGLLAYREYAPAASLPDVDKAIADGIKCYKGLFMDGMSLYRAPRRYPVDIHNQAQGIITFSELSDEFEDPSYIRQACEIADWTIDNMQDDSGYFYYQRWPLITNKIPYVRWGQAWMMLSLSTLAKRLKKKS